MAFDEIFKGVEIILTPGSKFTTVCMRSGDHSMEAKYRDGTFTFTFNGYPYTPEHTVTGEDIFGAAKAINALWEWSITINPSACDFGIRPLL